jgi:hypothetical protein
LWFLSIIDMTVFGFPRIARILGKNLIRMLEMGVN